MQEFGQYRIEGLIGSGGMGEVYRAYDTRRDREVALKLLPDVVSQDPEYQQRFRRESYAVARLREPHVVPIHDYGEIDNRLFIDMRLVDGQNLNALLARDGALPPARAISLVAQVADALDAAHADGLVHRDIKPSNILVTPTDFVYVVDFGIAHAVGHTRSRLTMTGATLGTLDYMAPERFENRPVDCRTDVYSLACVLFECLTAAKPYAAHDLPSLMYAHLYLEAPSAHSVNPAVPAELDAVIARGMAKNVDHRYPSAGELARAAHAALAGETHAVTMVAVGAEHRASAEAPTPSIPGTALPPTGLPTTALPTTALPTTALPTTAPPSSQAPPAPIGRGDRTEHMARPVAAPMGAHWPSDGPPDGARTALVTEPPRAAPPPPAAPSQPAASGKGGRRTLILLVVLALLAAAVVTTLVVTRAGSTADLGGAAPGVSGPGFQPAAPVLPKARSIAEPTVGVTVPVGPTPGYMEIAPNGKFAYIANREIGIVTVFDTTRRVVTGTIPVPEGGAQYIAFSPDGSRAFISLFNTARTVNLVGVVDTAKGEFIATVPVGVRPFALDVTPDGKRVYVPNHDSGSITVIDATTNTVSDTIQVAPNPHWVDVSDDGTRLYAANHESNVVTTIDTATNKVLGTVPVGASPHSILSLPGKPIVINANYDGNSVSVIDTTTNTVIKTVPTGNHPQDISLAADGKHAYIATVDDNAIQVLDTVDFTITATVPVGQSPTSVAVSPDGRQAYITNLADGTVTVLNIAGTA